MLCIVVLSSLSVSRPNCSSYCSGCARAHHNPQAGSGNKRCLKALLDAGGDGNLTNEDGLTPALIAAQGGHVGCLRVLAKAGADLSIRDLLGNSAAALAAMGGHLNCLEVHVIFALV